MNLINTVPRVDAKDLENMVNTSMNVCELIRGLARLSRSLSLSLLRIFWWFNISPKPSKPNWYWTRNWPRPNVICETIFRLSWSRRPIKQREKKFTHTPDTTQLSNVARARRRSSFAQMSERTIFDTILSFITVRAEDLSRMKVRLMLEHILWQRGCVGSCQTDQQRVEHEEDFASLINEIYIFFSDYFSDNLRGKICQIWLFAFHGLAANENDEHRLNGNKSSPLFLSLFAQVGTEKRKEIASQFNL